MSLNKPNVTQPQLDQPGTNFVLLTGGPSIALGATATGSDKLSEIGDVSANSGNFSSSVKSGTIFGPAQVALSDSITQLTVV